MLQAPENHTPLVELRQELMAHSLYSQVNNLGRLRVFMESHAFAVWDFMCLLKRLQADICPSGTPWIPPRDVAAARFINEIVLGEESDLDVDGKPAGHLDIYLRAMDEVGADASGFRAFLAMVTMGRTVGESLNAARARQPVRDFVGTTMQIATHGSTVEVASAFLNGREDPIPTMFTQLLEPLQRQGVEARRFSYYLERHIELDGDSHGPMGQELLKNLIAGDEGLQLASDRAGALAVSARIRFWSGVEREVHRLEGEGYREMMGV
jgi:hypothetical protein